MSAFVRPTRSEIISRMQTDVNGRMTGADSRLRRNWLNGTTTTLGGGLDGSYGYLDTIADQVMPDSADSAHLARWASFWGIFPEEATPASGPAASNGVASTDGTDVPEGTVLQRGDGALFTTTADATVAGGTVAVNVEAQVAGSAGNCDAGVVLTLVEPIAGVTSTFTVTGDGVQSGNDSESDASVLNRIEQRVQNPPQGGGPDDYVGWALQLPGVTRAWEYPLWMGLGTVGVAFVFDGREDIIPTDDDVTAMQALLESFAPVTAVPVAFAPTPYVVNYTITITPDNAGTEAAVEAELADFFTREAVPGGVLLASQYNQAISFASGLTDFTVTAPAGNVTPAAGEIPMLGTVDF